MPDNSVNDMKMAHGTQFLDRVQHQLGVYCKTVYAESTGTASHADRVALANRIMADPGNMAGKLAVQMVSNASLTGTYAAGPPVDSSASDAAVFGVINAEFNNWFGIL